MQDKRLKPNYRGIELRQEFLIKGIQADIYRFCCLIDREYQLVKKL